MTKRTGWPPGLLQDDSRELSRWFSTRHGARRQATEAAREIAPHNPKENAMSFVSYTPEQEAVLRMHSANMRRALTTMYRHLQDGIEWPDAVFKVTQEFNVVSDQLEALFDAVESA